MVTLAAAPPSAHGLALDGVAAALTHFPHNAQIANPVEFFIHVSGNRPRKGTSRFSNEPLDLLGPHKMKAPHDGCDIHQGENVDARRSCDGKEGEAIVARGLSQRHSDRSIVLLRYGLCNFPGRCACWFGQSHRPSKAPCDIAFHLLLARARNARGQYEADWRRRHGRFRH